MKLNRKKGILLLAAAMLILVCGVGSTLAYLATQTGQVQNTFEPAYVRSSVIEEDWKDGDLVKSNVTIKNTGNVSAYIRAAIVVTWKDAAGNTMPQAPGTGDYTLNIGSDWTKVGDYYYYDKSVAANDSTTKLIDTCEPNKSYPDGRKLCVEVIGSAIQSEGMGATSAQDAFAKAATGN